MPFLIIRNGDFSKSGVSLWRGKGLVTESGIPYFKEWWKNIAAWEFSTTIHHSLSIIDCEASLRNYIFSRNGTSTKSIAIFITASVLSASASLARASGFVSAPRIGQFW